jgi:hypothetical protein
LMVKTTGAADVLRAALAPLAAQIRLIFIYGSVAKLGQTVSQSLSGWGCRKYKKLRHHWVRAWAWLVSLIERQPTLLALWERQRRTVFTMGAV